MKLASKAIILNKNKYLLQLRDNKKNIYAPNCWGFFGGGSKRSETSEQCMKRELQEELSIKCDFLMKMHECMHYKTGTYLFFFYIKPNEKITKKTLQKLISQTKSKMETAAKEFDFIRAKDLRDELFNLKKILKSKK